MWFLTSKYTEKSQIKIVTDKIAKMLKKELGKNIYINTKGTGAGGNQVNTTVNINVIFIQGVSEPIINSLIDRTVDKENPFPGVDIENNL